MRKLYLLLTAILGIVFMVSSSILVGSQEIIDKTNFQEKYESATEIKTKYQLNNATLERTVKDDQRDKIEVTIGNKDSPDFLPELKITRWDEVSLTIKPKTIEGDKNLTFEGEKIRFETPKTNYILYELPDGFEYQIDLLEKPVTNKIELILDNQGLDFFYQPPLKNENPDGSTWEQNEGGGRRYRPADVVGSYAIYTSEHKINWEGEKIYGTGKIGHIYRPKIIDTEGNWVWGELNIDVINGILSVTIPQDFLDHATYPIRHAAGLTFGYTAIGASDDSNDGWAGGYNAGSITTLGTGTSLKIFAWDAGGTNHLKLAVYTSKTSGCLPSHANCPDALVANSYTGALTITQTTRPTTDSQGILGSNSPEYAASSDYWLMFGEDSVNIQLAYDMGGSTSAAGQTQTYAGFPPATISELAFLDNQRYSFYATYVTQCNPTVNQDWIITDSQTCDTDKNIGSGKVIMNTGGTLTMINGANFTARGYEINVAGDSLFFNTGSELRTA